MRLRTLLLALVCSALAAAPHLEAQTTVVTAAHERMAGADIQTGNISFVPVNGANVAVPFIDASGAQNGYQAFVCPIAGGAIAGQVQPDGTVSGTCTVPDSLQTTPQISYQVTVCDQTIGLSTSGKCFTEGPVPITGASFALDRWAQATTFPTAQAFTYASGITAPTTCVFPSQYLVTTPPVTLYNCTPTGTPVAISGGSGGGGGSLSIAPATAANQVLALAAVGSTTPVPLTLTPSLIGADALGAAAAAQAAAIAASDPAGAAQGAISSATAAAQSAAAAQQTAAAAQSAAQTAAAAAANALQSTQKGIPNGIADLDASGQIPLARLGNVPAAPAPAGTYTALNYNGGGSGAIQAAITAACAKSPHWAVVVPAGVTDTAGYTAGCPNDPNLTTPVSVSFTKPIAFWDAQAYGVLPSNPDNTAAMQGVINACQAYGDAGNGYGVIRVLPGKYYFNPASAPSYTAQLGSASSTITHKAAIVAKSCPIVASENTATRATFFLSVTGGIIAPPTPIDDFVMVAGTEASGNSSSGGIRGILFDSQLQSNNDLFFSWALDQHFRVTDVGIFRSVQCGINISNGWANGRLDHIRLDGGGNGYHFVCATPSTGQYLGDLDLSNFTFASDSRSALGSGATATATLNASGLIQSCAITAAGTNYSNASIAFTDSTGTGAGALGTVTVASGGVTSCTVTNPGTLAYTTPVATVVPQTSQCGDDFSLNAVNSFSNFGTITLEHARIEHNVSGLGCAANSGLIGVTTTNTLANKGGLFILRDISYQNQVNSATITATLHPNYLANFTTPAGGTTGFQFDVKSLVTSGLYGLIQPLLSYNLPGSAIYWPRSSGTLNGTWGTGYGSHLHLRDSDIYQMLSNNDDAIEAMGPTALSAMLGVRPSGICQGPGTVPAATAGAGVGMYDFCFGRLSATSFGTTTAGVGISFPGPSTLGTLTVTTLLQPNGTPYATGGGGSTSPSLNLVNNSGLTFPAAGLPYGWTTTGSGILPVLATYHGVPAWSWTADGSTTGTSRAVSGVISNVPTGANLSISALFDATAQTGSTAVMRASLWPAGSVGTGTALCTVASTDAQATTPTVTTCTNSSGGTSLQWSFDFVESALAAGTTLYALEPQLNFGTTALNYAEHNFDRFAATLPAPIIPSGASVASLNGLAGPVSLTSSQPCITFTTTAGTPSTLQVNDSCVPPSSGIQTAYSTTAITGVGGASASNPVYTIPIGPLGPGVCSPAYEATWSRLTGSSTFQIGWKFGSTPPTSNASSQPGSAGGQGIAHVRVCNNPGVTNAQTVIVEPQFYSAAIIAGGKVYQTALDLTTSQNLTFLLNYATTDTFDLTGAFQVP